MRYRPGWVGLTVYFLQPGFVVTYRICIARNSRRLTSTCNASRLAEPVGGGTFPCAISNYSDIEPPQYLFDLSLGYDTGDRPASSYLQNLHFQFVIQNLLDSKPAFSYRISKGGGGAPAAYDVTKNAQGRIFSLSVTKTW
jgi:hypothetical protein